MTPEQLVPEWRERAAGLGLTRGGGRRAHRARRDPTPVREADIEQITTRLAGPFGLTERRSTFTRRDVLQAWCEQLPADANVSVAEIERLADGFLRSPHAVVLAEGERLAVAAPP